jgi:hypothetical protein
MKYLSDYMEQRQTALFKKTGTFFAFSTKQYEEQAVKDKTYIYMGIGMYTEKQFAKTQIEQHYKIYKDSIKEDIKENGKDAIILRELHNHEAFYVGNIEDTIEKLKDYPITEDEINHIYSKNWAEETEKFY